MRERVLRKLVSVLIVFLLSFGILLLVSCGDKQYRIVIIPKLVGISYYDAVYRGVLKADAELPDLKVEWVGSYNATVEDQIEIIDRVIPSSPDAICVAANDNVAIVPVLRKARAAGIKIISWDGDSDDRDFFVNLVEYREFGYGLADAIAEYAGVDARVAVVTTSFTAPNQTLWLEAVQQRIKTQYPDMKILDIRPAGENTRIAYHTAMDFIRSMPDVDAILALGVPNVPGVAQAVEETGNRGKIKVIGNAAPKSIRDFLHKGTIQAALLWDAPAHGYLTVYAAYRFLTGSIKEGESFSAGDLGSFTPRKDGINLQVSLPLLRFSAENADDYDF